MQIQWRKPDFFIIGAPKCGTTSLANYLSERTDVCISNPKEPHYFSTDFKNFNAKTIEQYQRCFVHANDENTSIGEGSTTYLYSKVALQKILEFNPSAKFIVIVRNPIELVVSFHSELVWNLNENIKDFQGAWEAQSARTLGREIPLFCQEPYWLQYKNIGLLGEQVERAINTVGRDRVHVIVLDDMKENMRGVYLGVLKFLGLRDDSRVYFPVANESKVFRCAALRFFAKIGFWVWWKLPLPRFLNLSLQKMLVGVEKINIRKFDRQPLSPEFRRHLAAEFRDDVEKLSRLLERDLTHWLHIEN